MVALKSNDDAPAVDVYVDGVFVGTVTADGDGNWSLDVGTALSDGSHTVRAVATDGAGHSATDGGTFTVGFWSQKHHS